MNHRHRRGEVNGLHRQAGDRAPADLAVGHVEVFGIRRPRRSEGEHVLGARDRLAFDLVARLLIGGDVIQQLAARPPRRRIEARALDAADAPIAQRSHVHGPDRFVVVPRRRKGDLAVVGRPGGHEVFARVLGDLLELVGCGDRASRCCSRCRARRRDPRRRRCGCRRAKRSARDRRTGPRSASAGSMPSGLIAQMS